MDTAISAAQLAEAGYGEGRGISPAERELGAAAEDGQTRTTLKAVTASSAPSCPQ